MGIAEAVDRSAVARGDLTLRAVDVFVRFGGVPALTGVSIDAFAGEVLGLIGDVPRSRPCVSAGARPGVYASVRGVSQQPPSRVSDTSCRVRGVHRGEVVGEDLGADRCL